MSTTGATSFDEIRSKLQTIGASDSPALLNVSPWTNALGVYHQKKQQLVPEANKAMQMGKVLEETIAQLYEIDTGQKLKGSGQDIHVSPFWPWMHATPDRWREDGLLVEIKNSNRPQDWGAEYSDDVPVVYKVQCQHQMAVLNCDKMHLAVLISGSDFRVYELERDHALVEQIVRVCESFYKDNLLAGKPPAIDWEHPATPGILARLTAFKGGQLLSLDEDGSQLLQEYLAANKAMAALVERKDQIKAKILALMGDSASAADGGGRTARRAVVKRRAYQVNPSEYVRLDVHERKEK